MKKIFLFFAAVFMMLIYAPLQGSTYTKVTTAPTDWSGEYVLTAQVGSDVLMWTGEDAGQCHTTATLDASGKIEADGAITIVVEALTAGGYSVKVRGGANDGKYISSGTSAPAFSNGLKFNAAAHRIDFAMNGNGAVEMSQTISGNADASKNGTMYLLYNKSTGANNERFRFYKSSNLNGSNYLTPYLYKKDPSLTPEITASNLVVLTKDALTGEIPYTITNPNGSTLTAVESVDVAWITNLMVDAENNKVLLTVTPNTGEARTATIRLSYGTITKDVLVMQRRFVNEVAALPLAVPAGVSSDDLAETDGVTCLFDGSDYGNNTHKIKCSKNTHYLEIKTNARIGSCTFSVRGAASAGTSSFTIYGSANGSYWTEIQTLTAVFEAKDDVVDLISTEAFAATDRYIKLAFNKASGEVNCGLGKFTINAYETPASATISAAGYATFYNSTDAYYVASPAKAYTMNATDLSLIEIEDGIIPAATAVVLQGSAAATLIRVTTDRTIANNALQGAAADMTATEMAAANPSATKFYALSLNAAHELSSVGFYWVNADGAAFDITAGKAYLALTASTKSAILLDNEEVTALEDITTAELDWTKPVFNILGQQVAEGTTGVLIQNGTKHLVK